MKSILFAFCVLAALATVGGQSANFGTALNAPHLNWSTSPEHPWTVQSAQARDGSAVMSSDPFPTSGETWLKTSVSGPTQMSFRYSQRALEPGFEVRIDGNVVFGRGQLNWAKWALATIDIPSGPHEVKFSWASYGNTYSGFNGVVLDEVECVVPSCVPVISPASTADTSTAMVFDNSLRVTMTPGAPDGTIYYTLDGSTPTESSGIRYTGPVTLTRSTLVRAVEVDSGKEASAVVDAYYLKYVVPSCAPSISPASTADISTATTFADSLQVTLTPGSPDGVIYYTLDGTSPTDGTGILYTGPITLKKTTHVRAVEVDPNKGASAIVDAYFVEHHLLMAGEWTSNVDDVQAAASKDGKLICVMLGQYATCGKSQVFYPVAMSQTFCAWAKANGVYLVISDSTMYSNSSSANSWFWQLARSYDNARTVSTPTMYFARPSEANIGIAKGLGIFGQSIGSMSYSGSADSLIDCFSSILRANGCTPISLPPPTVSDILNTTGVTWTNSSSVPWRENYPNQMRAGGLTSSSFSSVLTAKVNCKGKFIFSYKAVSYSSLNAFSFAVNGSRQWKRAYNCNDCSLSYSDTVIYDVTSPSGATFTWTCTVEDPSCDYDENRTCAPCGAWIYDVKWFPESTDVTRQDGQGNTVVIPLSWFAANGLLASDADADADGDGMCNWHEYVCGTDPRDADSVLHCTIEIVNGEPVVDYAPKSGYLTGYHAVLMGSQSLKNANWGPKNADHRFFKVVLEK